MRFAAPPTALTAPRWCSIAALPQPLREAVSMRPLLEPIEGPMASWWKPSLMAAMVTIAGIAMFSPVIERWGGLRVVVAPALVGLLVAFARWWLDRLTVGVPATPGPGALQSLTTLVVVDGDAVMVLPGEHLERRNGILWYGPTAIDTRVHADDAWSRGLDDLAQRACANPIAREDDPWRELVERGVSITETDAHARTRRRGEQRRGRVAACAPPGDV